MRQKTTLADPLGWFLLALFFALGLALGIFGVVSTAHAEAPTLTERLVTAQGSLKSRKDAAVDPVVLASAIATVTQGNRSWSALILTVAAHESALSQRIADGTCREKECDGGRAWGLYQIHKNALNAHAWGSTDVEVQTREAAKTLKRAFYSCNRGPLKPDWARTTINAYAGKRCDAWWPGLEQRLATFERLQRQL